MTSKFEDITTKEIRSLFIRTFVDGKDNPSLRPTAEEFLEAFQNALDSIVVCPQCGFSRLYNYNQENLCINCGAEFDAKAIIVIYNVFRNLTRADGINSIGNYPQYDISMDGLIDIDGKLPPNHFEVSRIVLEPGEDKAKFLYLRHFEQTTNRSVKYARVTLASSLNSVKVEVLNNAFETPFLIEKQTRTMVPLNNGKEFPLDRYEIIFDTKKHGKLSKGQQRDFFEIVESLSFRLNDIDSSSEIIKNYTTVVGSTCAQADRSLKLVDLQNDKYDYVIIDEAARANPLDIMIPMMLGTKVILIGDHKQLPHYIESNYVNRFKNEKEKYSGFNEKYFW